MITFTTTDFVTSVKAVSHFPEGNSTFQPVDILRLGTMQLRTFIAPKVASVRENYWLTRKAYPITANAEYTVPSFSIGNGLVDVKCLTSTTYIPLDRIEISQLISTQFSPRGTYGFYIEDNLVKLLPNTGLSGDLVLFYYRIPSQLVPTTSCAQIEEINGTDLTVASLPTTATFSVSAELDISSQEPGFNVIVKDTLPTGIVGNVISFAELPNRIRVGDWISLSGQSCVVQAPIEWVEVLVQSTVCKIYEIQGYLSKLKAAQIILAEMEKGTTNVISPRLTEKSKIIQGGGSLNSPIGNWQTPAKGYND